MESFGADLETMRRQPLADKHVALLRENGEECSYPAGALLFDVGDPWDRFVYVTGGEIEIVDPFSGERLLDSTIGPTQFVGEIGFLNGGSVMVPMRAASATRTIEVERRRADAGRAHPYETSCDGIFAVGDVRAGSVKRVASAVGEGSVVVSRIWDYVETQRRATPLSHEAVSGGESVAA